MQKSSVNYASTSTPSSSSSSSTSLSHSSVTSHSLVPSSIDSTSSFRSSWLSSCPSRCFGLNLLVKAIHQVTAGSVVGVPYIQRRIITRRRRPLQFKNLVLTTTELLSKSGRRSKSKSSRQRRVIMTMPSKYRDSVLQPLTPKRRTERSSSVKITGE